MDRVAVMDETTLILSAVWKAEDGHRLVGASWSVVLDGGVLG
jgi:hypothetical protein